MNSLVSASITEQSIDYARKIYEKEYRNGGAVGGAVSGAVQQPVHNNMLISAALSKCMELVINEAISVVGRSYMGDNNQEDIEVRKCVKALKKHFGVE